MTSKADALRRRMSIDPDAPSPAPRRAARPAKPPETTGTATPTAPEPAPAPPAADAPPAKPRGSGARTPDAKAGPARPRSGSSAARGARRGAGADEPWATALDDPAIDAEGNGYRSFYVGDAVFARFRAAVYWTARRPDATGVPDNMSAGVEAYMDEVASDLERRYNDGDVFRATPDQHRAHRRRRS